MAARRVPSTPPMASPSNRPVRVPRPKPAPVPQPSGNQPGDFGPYPSR